MSRHDRDSRPPRDYDRGARPSDVRDDNRWRAQEPYRRSRSRSPRDWRRGRSPGREREQRWQHDRFVDDREGRARSRSRSPRSPGCRPFDRDRDRERGVGRPRELERERERRRSRSRSRDRPYEKDTRRSRSPGPRQQRPPTDDREEGEEELAPVHVRTSSAATSAAVVEEGEEGEAMQGPGVRDAGRQSGRDKDRPAGPRQAHASIVMHKQARPIQGEDAEEEEEYEDEESKAARLLEESRKRREAILAKHRGAPAAATSGTAVTGPGKAPPGQRAATSQEVAPSSSPPAQGARVLTDTHQLDVPMEREAVAASMFDGDDWDAMFATHAGAGDAGRQGREAGGEGEGEEEAGAGVRAGLDGDVHRQIRPGLQLSASTAGTAGVAAQRDTYDDPEGYYRARPGEILGAEGRYVVSGTGGRGVFSGVVFARDIQSEPGAASGGGGGGGAVPGQGASAQHQATDDASTLAEAAAGTVLTAAAPVTVGSSGALVKQYASLAKGSRSTVAIKVIRANDTMRRAGQAEIDILRAIATADPEGRYHVIKLLDTFEHRGHLCLVFEALACNLKELQTKFGKGVGLALKAVREYATQLLLSLALLAKLRIIHADIKPHNVLASERYNVVKLADLGSAFRQDDPENMPTPYLVSRFYRAPEVILSSTHSPALDMWSLACCLAELYTGVPLFPGEDNNDMLWKQQCMRGRFNHKALRRHIAHCGSIGAEAHFDPETLRFRRHTVDPVSKLPKTVAVDIPAEPSDSLAHRMAQKRSGTEDKKSVALFTDLLEKMLCLDPERRCTPTEALKHPFIREREGAGRR